MENEVENDYAEVKQPDRTINAGASLGLTLAFEKYENLKPTYWAGVTESVPADWSDKQIADRQKVLMENARRSVEEQIDKDISDVKDVKFYELLRMKRSELQQIVMKLFGKV